MERIINKDTIKALSPCESGYKNYLTYYSDFNGSLEDFLLLENIPYSDKIWLVRKVCVRDELVLWACKCAESVLHFYEKKYPNDFRPRKCIEVVLAERSISEIKEARAAYAADAAADAAAAAAADAADAAADAADAAAQKEQRNKNIQMLIEVIQDLQIMELT